jgi:hypothetical protein
MQRRSDATIQTVGDLVYSGLYGQLRTGDTLGLWTFNDKLHAGEFPVQGYVTEKRRAFALTQRVTGFLQKKKYERTANLAIFIPSLEPIVKGSRLLTVILVSDGLTKISCTPYDDKINQMYASWAPEQQKLRKPIFTILRAQEGKWVHFSVSPAQWKPEFPPLPVEPRPDLLATPKTNKTVYGQPLIVSGKKPVGPQPTPQTNAAPVVTATNPPPQANQLAPTPVPQPAITTPPPAQVQTTTNPPAVPKPAIATPPPTNALAKTAPATGLATVEVPAPATNLSNTLAQTPTGPRTGSPEARPDTAVKTTPAAPATQATTVPATTSKWLILLVGAASLLVVLLAITVFLRSRPRPRQHISLITRSLDRNQPPRQ